MTWIQKTYLLITVKLKSRYFNMKMYQQGPEYPNNDQIGLA